MAVLACRAHVLATGATEHHGSIGAPISTKVAGHFTAVDKLGHVSSNFHLKCKVGMLKETIGSGHWDGKTS